MEALDMSRPEFRDRQIAERRNEVLVDDDRIAVVTARGNLRLHTREPCGQPLPNRHAGRVNMLAGVERAQQPPQFLVCVLAGAPDRGGCDLALAGGGIGAERVADLEGARRPLADMAGPTRHQPLPFCPCRSNL
jgi:hypothetical protein